MQDLYVLEWSTSAQQGKQEVESYVQKIKQKKTSESYDNELN